MNYTNIDLKTKKIEFFLIAKNKCYTRTISFDNYRKLVIKDEIIIYILFDIR